LLIGQATHHHAACSDAHFWLGWNWAGWADQPCGSVAQAQPFQSAAGSAPSGLPIACLGFRTVVCLGFFFFLKKKSNRFELTGGAAADQLSQLLFFRGTRIFIHNETGSLQPILQRQT